MKIIVFGGGLGNQIFGYAFSEYLRKVYNNQKIYGVYNHQMMSEHYGLEINKWFDVNLPPSKWYATLLTYILYGIKKLTGWQKYVDTSQYVMNKDKAIVYFAQHTDKRYIPQCEWIRFKMPDTVIGRKNIEIIDNIRKTNSVFIHVRRGDYLSPKYKERFDGCCTLEYYESAINYIKKKVESPTFYVFSNDIDWCRENLPIENPTYVDWNTGSNSPIDMYLMSQCKYGIMANSTFSYWGALLGDKKIIVTYPDKWVNPPFTAGDIFPEEWIRI